MIEDLIKFASVSAFALSIASGPVAAQNAFSGWDGNGDGLIDAAEFESGLVESGLFSSWDMDADESLSEEELEAGMGDRDVHYAAWDADGDAHVRESEFFSGLFSVYDTNADGTLGEDEFDAFEEDAYFPM